MSINISKQHLIKLLIIAAELGATAALKEAGLVRPYLSKQEAYNMYGMANVKRWFKEGLLTPIKDGQASAKWRIDRLEIKAVAKSSNRSTYLSAKERKRT